MSCNVTALADPSTVWCTDELGAAFCARPRGPNSPLQLQRRTVLGFEQCLGGKHILLMGDSRVRYQYLSLVHLLSQDAFPRCAAEGGDACPNDTCSVINERVASSWTSFYEVTHGKLTQNPNVSAMCDCYRHDRPAFDPDRTRENRFFSKTTLSGEIRLTYLQAFWPPHNNVYLDPRFPPMCENSQLGMCSPGQCHDNRTIRFTAHEAVETIVPLLHPTHVFASQGGGNGADFGCTLARLQAAFPAIRTFFLTHPADADEHAQLAQNKTVRTPMAQSCNASVFDRFTPTLHAPRGLYWDRLHVLGSANGELNQLMANLVCGDLA